LTTAARTSIGTPIKLTTAARTSIGTPIKLTTAARTSIGTPIKLTTAARTTIAKDPTTIENTPEKTTVEPATEDPNQE
jgi:hypothetical protein